jgi:hypothetical protein
MAELQLIVIVDNYVDNIQQYTTVNLVKCDGSPCYVIVDSVDNSSGLMWIVVILGNPAVPSANHTWQQILPEYAYYREKTRPQDLSMSYYFAH